MDSINKNQPEHNHEDLAGAKAIKKMADLIKQAQTCFFWLRPTLAAIDPTVLCGATHACDSASSPTALE